MRRAFKVVHMGSAHSPDDVRVFQKECRTLASAGYEVVLVVQAPQDVVVEGVRIRAARPAASRTGRFTATLWDMLRIALDEDADIYHLHGPDLIPVGLLLKARGKTVIYDAHETFSGEILTKFWIPAAVRKPVAWATEAVEGLGARTFDAVIAATPTIASAFPADKTVIVRNFPRLEELSSGGNIPYAERGLVAAYVGGITAVKCVREMVQAIALLPESLRAHLLLVGKFEHPQLEQEVRAMPGWSRVDYQGWRNRQEINSLLGESRLGMVVFANTPNHVRAEPNKLFEYMAAGLPVIASDFSYWRELIGSARAGLTVPPDSPQKIAEAMAWLFSHPEDAEAMGRNGAAAVGATYNWECEAMKLLDLYQRLAPAAHGYVE